MVSNPTAAPILFDRALLRVRQNRARRGEPATFLLDRVTEDMEERLHAVLRQFADAADIWTPGEILRKPSRDRFKSVTPISLDETGNNLWIPDPHGVSLGFRVKVCGVVRGKSRGRRFEPAGRGRLVQQSQDLLAVSRLNLVKV